MGAHVTIRVRFPDGRPAPGARIVGTNHDAWLKRHRTWSATADLSGAFTWENLDRGTLGDRYTFSVSVVDGTGATWQGEVSERIRARRELLVVLQRDDARESGASPARRLAAIMFIDLVGFTRIAQVDEARALRLIETQRRLVRESFGRYGGNEVKTMGDGFLAEFESTFDACRCGLDLQEQLGRHNREAAPEDAVRVRVGIHVGDVVHAGHDILGDAVNIASRILPLAEPGGICVSEEVFAQVRSRLSVPFVPVDTRSMKPTVFPIAVYRMVLEGDPGRTLPEPGRAA